MRGLLLGAGTLLFNLLGGCSNLEPVASRTEAIHVVTGRACDWRQLQLFDGLNYTGTLLCLDGTGTYWLPPTFTVLSFKAGEYTLTFHDPSPANYTCPPLKTIPWTINSTVHDAWAVTRALPTFTPNDAGLPGPGPCHY